MKIKRSTKEYGGGSGKRLFESDMFQVWLWNMSHGICTNIECKLLNHYEIVFDGKQEFKSDRACMEQFTSIEIIKMIGHQKEISFQKGIEAKVLEIKKCLEISVPY